MPVTFLLHTVVEVFLQLNGFKFELEKTVSQGMR